MNILKQLVLASQSPRRIGLLRQIGIAPLVIPSHVQEIVDEKETPTQNAMRLARKKAAEVGTRCTDAIVVGADTIVVLDKDMLNKPDDPEDARRMLRLLSGRTHTVVTGFSLLDCPSGLEVSAFESTRVTFRSLPEEEIAEYVEGGSPMDKAGAYGIQDDYGAVFVTRIEGCFYNVVGFPLAKFYSTLQQFQTQLTEQRTYAEKN